MLNYNTWHVGESVTKNVVLKNTLFTAVRITPSTPKSAWFSLKTAPQTTMISAGTSLSLGVVFKPTEALDYDDSIEITTPDGTLTVQLRARLPRPDLVVPKLVEAPIVAVGASSTQKFAIGNPGQQPVTWRIAAEPPFFVTPSCGELNPREETFITLNFSPKDARLHRGSLVLKSDGPHAAVAPLVQAVAVEGHAAFAHIAIDGAAQLQVPGYATHATHATRYHLCSHQACSTYIYAYCATIRR